jgi:hypothetical protein
MGEYKPLGFMMLRESAGLDDLLFARFSSVRFALFLALKRSFPAFFPSENDSKDL